MIYLKEPNTNKMVEFQSEASIGAFFENWTVVKESEILAYELEKAKEVKKSQINKQRDNNKNENILFAIDNEDYYFQRDIVSQLAFVNAIVSSDDIAISSWITADNSVVEITKSDLISICAHIKQRDDVEHYQARKRKDAVNALESIEAVENYDITTVYE